MACGTHRPETTRMEVRSTVAVEQVSFAPDQVHGLAAGFGAR